MKFVNGCGSGNSLWVYLEIQIILVIIVITKKYRLYEKKINRLYRISSFWQRHNI